MNSRSHMLRCTGCGARIAGSEARSNFRCVNCGDLFEVVYPWSASEILLGRMGRSRGFGQAFNQIAAR